MPSGSVASSLTVAAQVSPISGVDDLRNGKVPPDRVGLREGSAPGAGGDEGMSEGREPCERRIACCAATWFVRSISPVYYHLAQTEVAWVNAMRAGTIDVFIWNGAKILYQARCSEHNCVTKFFQRTCSQPD